MIDFKGRQGRPKNLIGDNYMGDVEALKGDHRALPVDREALKGDEEALNGDGKLLVGKRGAFKGARKTFTVNVSSLCHVICGTQTHDLTLYCHLP